MSKNEIPHAKEVKPYRLIDYFNDPDMSQLAEAGIALYPDFPYHNPRHGHEVVAATYEILRLYGDVFDDHERDLLLLAAAWHDAGFGDSEQAWKPHGSKEAYAAYLLRCAVGGKMDDENIAFMQRAIMGTVITAERDTPEARLLHLADMSYVWGNPETFMDGAQKYRDEEVPHMPFGKFIEFQKEFLGGYITSIVREYLSRDGVGQNHITAIHDKLQKNLEALEKISPESIHSRLSRLALSLTKHG